MTCQHCGDGRRGALPGMVCPGCAAGTYRERGRFESGDPTVYRVLSDPDDADSAYTGFAVVQTEHRGSAVPVRSYPVKGDVFAVQLTDRGRDWGDAKRAGAHHAAAQMKASCH